MQVSQILFDDNGNLFPYDVIVLNIQEIQMFFVNNFRDSSSRSNIFSLYKSYLNNLCGIINIDWKQWINGSFISSTPNPNDIDLVNFINADVVNNCGEAICPFLSQHGNPRANYHVDGYLIPVYSENDPRYSITQRRMIYWRQWFGTDKAGNPKGIIETKLLRDSFIK